MLGFLCCSNSPDARVKSKEISFVSFPDGLSEEEIRIRFSKMARDFANYFDTNIVYLNYGKDNFIKYEYRS